IDEPTGAGGPGLDRGARRDGGHRGHRVVARRPVCFLAARRPSAGGLVTVCQHSAGRPLRGGRVLRPLPCRDRRELSPPPDGPLAAASGRTRRGRPRARVVAAETPGVTEAPEGPPLWGGGGLESSIERRAGRFFHRETRRDASGRVVARNEAEVKFVLGSGN